MIVIAGPAQIHRTLAHLRYDADLTQQKLADTAGFKVRQVNAWENDGQRPNLASLIRLLGALGYDLALVPREDA